MGLFLNVLIVKNSTEENVRKTLERMEDSNLDWNLISAKCRYQECHNGVKVLLSDMCAGYKDMTQKLSKELMCPVLLCYIYDEDYWGYYFYEKGIELDSFNPMPDYFEEVSEKKRQRFAGNGRVIAEYFNVEESKIKNYLQQWSYDILDSMEGTYAYDGDEFCMGDAWQMADFMKAIGYPYGW